MQHKRLVVDATILIRAVFGQRVRQLIADSSEHAAAARLMNCPIWTEDEDFFGTGVPTWTTATVEIYLGLA